jgi:hypothetical protein
MNEYSGAADRSTYGSVDSSNSNKIQNKVDILKRKAVARARNEEWIKKRMTQL